MRVEAIAPELRFGYREHPAPYEDHSRQDLLAFISPAMVRICWPSAVAGWRCFRVNLKVESNLKNEESLRVG